MIYLYSGTPGSGKSYHALCDIVYQCKRGRPVLCNFPVKGKNVDYLERMVPDGIVAWSLSKAPGKYKESYSLVCIDEAQLILNSRTWNSKDRLGWNAFFSQHRKLCLDVILISQSDILIDKQVRALIEYEYIHRKALAALDIGVSGLILAEKYWYGRSSRIGTKLFLVRKRICSLYDTTSLFGSLRAEEYMSESASL